MKMLLADVFGNLSQLFWISAQLPQVWKNYNTKSVEGLSFPFLLNWLLGDITNLIGCLFTNQLSFQRNLAIYFNLIDLILIGQFILYSKLPLPSSLNSGNSTSNSEGLRSEPPTVLHPSLDLERNSINKLGLELSSHHSAISINHSISNETSKSSSLFPHSRLHPCDPFNPTNPSLNFDENLGLNTHSSRLSTTTQSRSVQSIGCYRVTIFMFLALLGFTIFETKSVKNLFSPIHPHHSTYLQDHPSLSETAPIHDELKSNIRSNNAYNHILPSLHLKPSSILQSTEEVRDVLSQFNPSTFERKENKDVPIMQQIGRISAWLCAFLYLTSRIPQIYKNYSRKSVEGLSILLFILAFLGNFTYVASIIASATVLGRSGSQYEKNKLRYLNEFIPYLIGSAGTLCFDFTIFIQSWIYRKPPVHLLNSHAALSTTSDTSES